MIRFGLVTSTSPLEVQLDGTTGNTPVAAIVADDPAALKAALVAGVTRVAVEERPLEGRKVQLVLVGEVAASTVTANAGPLAGVKAFEIQTASFAFSASATSAPVTLTYSTAFAATPGSIAIFPGIGQAWAYLDVRSQGIYADRVALIARTADEAAVTLTASVPIMLIRT